MSASGGPWTAKKALLSTHNCAASAEAVHPGTQDPVGSHKTQVSPARGQVIFGDLRLVSEGYQVAQST